MRWHMDVIKINKPVYIAGTAAIVGKREHEGPLGADFDMHDDSEKFGMDTWEKAESEMQRRALTLALANAGMGGKSPDAVFAGDLMNQCTSSAYGLMDFQAPYFGLYGACSTFAESLMLSALMVNAEYFNACAAVTSSHFCTAERQFRFPLEYGGQRTPTAQRTATASGAAVVSSDSASDIKISEVLPGRIIDKGITDINNMGAAMAPAAIDTLTRYFSDTGSSPDDFDMILTGDLGREGHGIVCDIMLSEGKDLRSVYNDCGLLLYNIESQDMHAGGSGCGCSAAVIAGHIMKRMRAGELHNVLYLATGALMSPGSVFQGLSIPAIAHLVHFTA